MAGPLASCSDSGANVVDDLAAPGSAVAVGFLQLAAEHLMLG